MAQVDTKHNEKDKLFSLMAAELEPQNIKFQIAQTKAKMDKSDIEEVIQQFEEYKKAINK
jgi:2,4-dienoyl-CoA reductase-like NADH-dependent reductase (Old Yellow Enzyme family)